MHVVDDNPWNSLTPTGWTMRGGGSGKLAIGSDASAPASPSSVLQFKYPAGFSGSGSAPGSEYFTGFDSSKELFVAFDWKVSADWQQHTAGFSKLIYLVHCSYCNTTSQPGGRIAYVMMMQGHFGGPYHLMMNDEIYNTNKIQPNVGDGTVVPGRWYRVEISVKGQSTSGANDGWIKFWIDGRPVAQYLNLPIPSRGFTQLTIDPVWGGVDPTISKTHTDYMWFDHIHVSAR
ncbi:MAG TPA: heparin lyase I family protein [Gemmatimonadaceae bacterium]|nr:heparin lyase I family protein [Gemmatimonadaceae bacterium]